jgi:U32 family peptidase
MLMNPSQSPPEVSKTLESSVGTAFDALSSQAAIASLPLVAPELLSPAGDWDCVHAAIENGADAIYFGLDCGFNARFRAKNFHLDDLPRLCSLLRSRDVRGYVTFNTLVFPSEMPDISRVIRLVAEAGIDAILVQDFGVARLAHAICPELELHASTQMSMTSAETIAVARSLGLSRVVLARELSIAEISKITSATDMPVEVFIHGALCVAYSGQCLTSESLGGRSANRGQCAQACRLPYDLVCDGVDRDLDDAKYLLSPQDLAGYEAIPELIRAKVASLKIEGRLKTPEYVANLTAKYRQAIDNAMGTSASPLDETDRREMELSFSRGFTPGWLDGNDHKRLVPGRTSSKTGILLGDVQEVRGGRIQIHTAAPLALGDGIAIHAESMIGGRIYELIDDRDSKVESIPANRIVWISLGRELADRMPETMDRAVFKNDDPALNKRLRQSFTGADPTRRRPIDMHVTARVGKPLRVTANLGSKLTAQAVGTQPLQAANHRPIDEATLQDKLGRLGGTIFELAGFKADIVGGPMVPLSLLNEMRRQLVTELTRQLQSPVVRTINVEDGQTLLQPITEESQNTAPQSNIQLNVLCRTLEQTQAVCESGLAPWVYLDFHDVRQYRAAADRCRSSGQKFAIASVRMQKPGEMGLLRVIPRCEPDAILCRNLAAVDFCRQSSIPIVADFSLNVTNHRSAQWIRSLGAIRITASYDLNADQLDDLIESLPADWMELVVHQHMPMFHMEHCVFCSVLSPGTNKTNCGRPCDRHTVNLRDRVGALHVLQADVACRNTLYNQTPQSGAEVVPRMIRSGVAAFRIELLPENASQTTTTLGAYADLIAGRTTPKDVWQRLQADNRLGVTRGTLETARNPLKIL